MHPRQFTHDALLYEDDAHFIEGTVGFLRSGLDAGEHAMVATDERKIGLLRDTLGDTNGSIKYVNMHAVGRNPARLIQLWRDFLDDHPGPARGVGEPVWAGRDDDEIAECQIHEMLINHAFAQRADLSLLCPYELQAFDESVIHGVACNHGNDRQVVSPFVGKLVDPPQAATEVTFDRGNLSDVRSLSSVRALEFGFDAERAAEVVLAVHEVTSNSIRHGDGSGRVATWQRDDAIVFDVRDTGSFEDPLVGRVFPDHSDDSGRGLWLTNQLVDLLQIRCDASGSTMRLTFRSS